MKNPISKLISSRVKKHYDVATKAISGSHASAMSQHRKNIRALAANKKELAKLDVTKAGDAKRARELTKANKVLSGGIETQRVAARYIGGEAAKIAKKKVIKEAAAVVGGTAVVGGGGTYLYKRQRAKTAR